MKLEKIQIENFRGIKHLELDFRDELERIQDVVPIVGPNTSGKTAILDAITVCLGPGTEIWTMRPDLVLSPASLVRRGSLRARVKCTVRFSDAEIAKTKDIFVRTGFLNKGNFPESNRVTVDWEYPDPTERHQRGLNTYDPAKAHLLFKGRKRAVRHFYVPGVSSESLRQLGGIFMFDQKRTGLGQRTSSQLRDRAAGRNGPPNFLKDGQLDKDADSYTRDPRMILLNLAVRAQAAQSPEATEREDFNRFCELYARVCKPHRINRVYNAESGLDIEFEGPNGIYFFEGLSTGQIMLLSLLLQFVTNRIHSSIVLIDELELHLHPLWQTRLYQSLGELGFDNQVLFTTHSTHLRDLIRGNFVHCTGELGDEPAAKGGA